MTQKWLIFAADATQTYIDWHMARNKDAVGYFRGIPPCLSEQATAESWELPHVWLETITDPDAP